MNRISFFINQHPWTSFGGVLIMLFGFQILNIVYGFDVNDTGFHLIAYENVFSAPDCVAYNFMYYLTNIVGGALMSTFSDLGVLGFRIVGALLVLLTLVIIFLTLKNTIPVIHLLLGSILVVLAFVKPVYVFNNAILSCCLYAVSIVFLYKGLCRKELLLVILSGLIVGLNIFTRIPNILGVGLVLIILLHKKYYLKINGFDWRNSFCFLIGVSLGVLIVLGIMVRMGHVELFFQSLLKVYSMAGGEGSHNLLWMFKIHIAFYLSAIIPLLVFYALIHIEKRVESKGYLFTVAFYIVSVLSVFLYVYETRWTYVVIWGFIASGCIICVLKNRNQLGILALLALYMLIFEIYGSDSGINHGGLPALLAAPIASMQLLNRKIMIYVFTFVLAVCWQVIRKGNFQDSGPIYQKTEKIINCLEAKGILTTKENAYAINTTLKGIKSYVSTGDTMICFPSAPMMNYLTHTRPAGGSCQPGISGFILPIEGTPKILFNKVPFTGNGWTEVYKLDDKYDFDIKSFILEHNYRKVYENDYFMLFVPPVS